LKIPKSTETNLLLNLRKILLLGLYFLYKTVLCIKCLSTALFPMHLEMSMFIFMKKSVCIYLECVSWNALSHLITSSSHFIARSSVPNQSFQWKLSLLSWLCAPYITHFPQKSVTLLLRNTTFIDKMLFIQRAEN